MTYNDFITEIWLAVDNCPKDWRKGQKVFNVIEDLYGNVAREVQFIDGVDCFYDDSDETINLFIDKCWYRMCSTNLKKQLIMPILLLLLIVIFSTVYVASAIIICEIFIDNNISVGLWPVLVVLLPIVNTIFAIKYNKKFSDSFNIKKFLEEIKNIK